MQFCEFISAGVLADGSYQGKKKKSLGSGILDQFVEHRDKSSIPLYFLINSTNRCSVVCSL